MATTTCLRSGGPVAGGGAARAGEARHTRPLRAAAVGARSTQRGRSGHGGRSVVMLAASGPGSGSTPASFLGSGEEALREQLGPYMVAAVGGAGVPGVLGSVDGSDDYSPVLRVAYQGVPGAYSECASLQVYADGEMVPCDSFDIAFQAVTEWMADRAVLPIENSLGGSIHRNYDLLMKHRLHIVGEVSVAVNHCLLALPGVHKKDLKRVISHPQALSQTEGYCSRVIPGAAREEFPDTAGAASEIARQGWMDTGAVASRRAAELYGLEVLDEAIQDDKSNVTRFMVLSRDPLPPQGMDNVPFKTSIVFSLNEGPGMLFKALSVFALRDIDLTKIESRPMRSDPIVETQTGRRFKFLFYIDFVGTMSDVEIAPFMRVLGSYPMDMNDPTKSH